MYVLYRASDDNFNVLETERQIPFKPVCSFWAILYMYKYYCQIFKTL